MKLRHPGLIRLLAFLAAFVIRIWMSTVRLRVRMHDWTTDPDHPRCRRPCLHAFWHEGILALTSVTYRNPVYVLVSQHADGELIAQIVRHMNLKTVRGSTTRGGAQAVVEMLARAEGAHLAITPDGPKGPRRQVQRGVVFLASRSGLPVVPYGIAFSRAWRARSWDRFAVPLPFSTIFGIAGAAVVVPRDLNLDDQEAYRSLVECELKRATAQAEAWAAHGAARRRTERGDSR
jgi:lysophospholipid acyltransferase (LPLAT)-like uncharacterized protein